MLVPDLDCFLPPGHRLIARLNGSRALIKDALHCPSCLLCTRIIRGLTSSALLPPLALPPPPQQAELLARKQQSAAELYSGQGYDMDAESLRLLQGLQETIQDHVPVRAPQSTLASPKTASVLARL